MIVIVCLLILGVLAMLFLKTRKYQQEYVEALDKGEHSLKSLYPIGLWLIMETPLGGFVQEKTNQRENIAKLHIGEDKDEMQILHWCKKIAVVYLCLVATTVINLGCATGKEGTHFLKEQRYLEKSGAEENEKNLKLIVSSEGKEDVEVSVEVPSVSYTSQELEQKMQEAKDYVLASYLGENDSNRVSLPLNLVEYIPGSAIEIYWEIENRDLIEENGQLKNGLLKEARECMLTAVLVYRETEETIELPVTVLPATDMSQEEWEDVVDEAIYEAGTQNPEGNVMELPSEIYGKEVTFSEPKEKESLTFVIFGIIVCVLLWYLEEEKIKSGLEKREHQMMLDYPELINKFTLLIGAGMTIHSAWEKIACEYQEKMKREKKNRRYAYDEWCLTWTEMSNGVTEMEALERFGTRTKLMPYLRFSTLLSQNLRKGSKGLTDMLEYEAADAFEKRKQNTKKLAEQAGTKLLGPMILMLILVVLIIMAPAMMSI